MYWSIQIDTRPLRELLEAEIATPPLPAFEVRLGDAVEQLKNLPEACIQTVITSPPYFQLRDYGADGQIGQDMTVTANTSQVVDSYAWSLDGEIVVGMNSNTWTGGASLTKAPHSLTVIVTKDGRDFSELCKFTVQ